MMQRNVWERTGKIFFNKSQKYQDERKYGRETLSFFAYNACFVLSGKFYEKNRELM
jgi:hypothetical protein